MHLGSREEETQALCNLRGRITELPMKTSHPPLLHVTSVSKDGHNDRALGNQKKIETPFQNKNR